MGQRFRHDFIVKTDFVGQGLACLFVIEPVDFLEAGIGNFRRIFGNLDFRNKFPVFILDGGKFVNPSE